MKRLSDLLRSLPALLALAAFAVPAAAGDGDSGLRPDIPEPLRGDSCVEETEDMRRNHMDYLKGHRDEVMHQGIRTKKYSLKECLSCHVPTEGEARQAGRSEDQHFCQNCHEYAGVELDCFQCHNTRPQEPRLPHPLKPRDQQTMQDAGHPATAELLNNQAESDKNETGVAQ